MLKLKAERDEMAWMKKARVKCLNRILELVKEGVTDEVEVIKTIMREEWVSRTTAQRYIDDLIFMGRIKRNNGHLVILEEKKRRGK